MPVFHKGTRVPWIIPGADPDAYINLDYDTFTPDLLPKGKIIMGDDSLVRIPQIKNRITKRKDGYIELVIDRYYDKESQQTRNHKKIIGQECGFLPGMMTPNDNYYDFFDGQGLLYNPGPLTEEGTKDEEEDQAKESQTKQSRTLQQNKETERKKPKARTTEEPATSNTKDEEIRKKEKALAEREQAVREKEWELKKLEKELYEWQEELEAEKEKLYITAQEGEKDHINLLHKILRDYIIVNEKQANKKPNQPMTQKQIQTINELLRELKDFFKDSETENYLHLAEEPDETTDNPGTTNGEMALLLYAYDKTTSTFLYHGLRKNKKRETRETRKELITADYE